MMTLQFFGGACKERQTNKGCYADELGIYHLQIRQVCMI